MCEPKAEDRTLETEQPSLDEPEGLRGFSVEESDEIVEEAARGRVLDRRLAENLEQRPTTRPASGAYLHALGRRGRLSASAERELVRAAVSGEREARASER